MVHYIAPHINVKKLLTWRRERETETGRREITATYLGFSSVSLLMANRLLIIYNPFSEPSFVHLHLMLAY